MTPPLHALHAYGTGLNGDAAVCGRSKDSSADSQGGGLCDVLAASACAVHAGVGEHAQQERTFEEVPPGIYRMTVLQLSGTDGAMHEGHASSGGGRLRRQGPFVFECLSATHEWHAFQAQLLQQRPHNLIHPPEPGMHAHVPVSYTHLTLPTKRIV